MKYIIPAALVFAGFVMGIGSEHGIAAVVVTGLGMFGIGHYVSGEDLVY